MRLSVRLLAPRLVLATERRPRLSAGLGTWLAWHTPAVWYEQNAQGCPRVPFCTDDGRNKNAARALKGVLSTMKGSSNMVTYADQKPKTLAESEFDRAKGDVRPEVRISQSNSSTNSIIAVVVAALVVLVGGYLLYTNYAKTPQVVPPITQNNTTVPATPPAAETVTPPAIGSTPPAATVPATPPAAGTKNP
jgi:hypothetical protein